MITCGHNDQLWMNQKHFKRVFAEANCGKQGKEEGQEENNHNHCDRHQDRSVEDLIFVSYYDNRKKTTLCQP